MIHGRQDNQTIQISIPHWITMPEGALVISAPSWPNFSNLRAGTMAVWLSVILIVDTLLRHSAAMLSSARRPSLKHDTDFLSCWVSPTGFPTYLPDLALNSVLLAHLHSCGFQFNLWVPINKTLDCASKALTQTGIALHTQRVIDFLFRRDEWQCRSPVRVCESANVNDINYT